MNAYHGSMLPEVRSVVQENFMSGKVRFSDSSSVSSEPNLSHSLNSLKGDYIGDYIGNYYWGN